MNNFDSHTYYNDMPNGDLLITVGGPYIPGPISCNNPFLRPLRVYRDHGEYDRGVFESLRKLSEMLKEGREQAPNS